MLKHNLLAFALAYAATTAGLRGEDWPTYGHDVARSQTTAEPVPTPLAPCWVFGRDFRPRPLGRTSGRGRFAPSGTAYTSTMPFRWPSPADGSISARPPTTRSTAWTRPRAASAGRRSPAGRSAWRRPWPAAGSTWAPTTATSTASVRTTARSSGSSTPRPRIAACWETVA